MPKAYRVTTHRSIKDAEAMAAYARLARPALVGAGGRVLVRGMPAHVYELGLQQHRAGSPDRAGCVMIHPNPTLAHCLEALERKINV